MNSSRIKIVVVMLLCVFMAMPTMAQPMGWYHKNTKEEDNAIKRVFSKNQVGGRHKEFYNRIIKATFDEMWRTADKDSLYDWSRVDNKEIELERLQDTLRLLSEEQAAKSQARLDEGSRDDWASDDEIREFERFRDSCIKEINNIKIPKTVEKDTLRFVKGWTQSHLDAKLKESQQVKLWANTWDGTSSPEADAMLKKYEAMEDEMILLCEMDPTDYKNKKGLFQEIQKGNQDAQLEQQIKNYLANEKYDEGKTLYYIEQYNGKDERLRNALMEQETIYKELSECLSDFTNDYLRLDRPEYREKVSAVCDSKLTKYNERAYPYLDNLRTVISNLKDSVNKGDLNTNEGFKKYIKNAKDSL